MNNRQITLYDQVGEPTVLVQLTEEGWNKYQDQEPWNPDWIELMLDLKRIKEVIGIDK